MSARTFSIRSRLLVLLVGATALVWAVSLSLSYFEARRELNALFDAQLAESAKVMLMQARGAVHEAMEHDEDDGVDFEHVIEHPYEQKLHGQIWSGDGRLVYQSSRDLPPEPLVKGIANGYADRTLHGTRWRVLVLTDPESRLQIQLCQSYESREGLAGSIARSMLVPLIVALPLLGALIWLGTGSGIRPLAQLESDLRRRAPVDLDPIAEEGLPRELQPMVRALNGLLERLKEQLGLERRFTADAAHELRTPLAALKTQAQVALAARNDQERAHALGQIVRGIDRTTHLVQQLLTLARLDPGAEEPAERIPLDVAVREAVSECGESGRVRIAAEKDVVVKGSRPLLMTLIRNLVENALRHGGAGEVRVNVSGEGDEVVLSVADDGPGIPPEERERVFDRFYRATGSDQRGSGLGLSIVKRIVELHGGAVELGGGEGGGVRVVVRLKRIKN